MALDASLTLHDGTAITADRDPTSTVVSGGSVCVDLGAGQAAPGSGARDLVAILVDPDGLTSAADDIAVSIQGCATVDGTYTTICSFDTIGANSTGGHDGSAGSVQILKFSVDPAYRYIKAYINITDAAASDFSEVIYVFLSNAGFYNL